MSNVQPRAYRPIPTAFGVLTLLSVGVLLTCDVFPRSFPSRAHDLLAALPLVLIAIAYVVYQAIRRVPPLEWVKAAMLALAFLFWAANQICLDRRWATLFNDSAIAAFVFDVFLVIVGWPRAGAATAARSDLASVREESSASAAPERAW
jgi:hypothetical protein